ncbi:MAG: DUF6273 domain-containing protein [Muricomes sp.]
MKSRVIKKSVEERIIAIEEELKAIKEERSLERFKGLGIKDEFQLIGVNWKILDITEKGYLCLAESIDDSMEFDSDFNNWEPSDLRDYLNTKVFNRISDEIGSEYVIPFERDLLSLDGQTEYGKCRDKVSLLNVDEYRKYRSLIPNTDKWWWTITPWSTACNNDSTWVTVVSPSGNFNYYFCYGGHGVRPFCIFSSALFES